MSQRDGEHQELYQRALEAFRAADWQAAITTLELLQGREGPGAETERLLADARLKAGVERAELPAARPMKKPFRLQAPALRHATRRSVAIGIAGVSVVAIAAWFFLSRGISPTTVATEVIQPLLGAMADRTEAAMQTFTTATEPTLGTLELRWTEDRAPRAVAPNVEIILDASGSMLARAGEQRRIVVAQTALRTLVEQLPEQTSVALRVYGRQRAKDCSDTELVQPLAKLDRAGLINLVETTQPVPEANTPLALSLQKAAEDMQAAQGDVLVLVVSDGEDTCDGNLVQAVADLRAARPNVRVSVVGFSVGPEQWRKQLQDAAAQGGGGYFDAATPEQLTAALSSAVAVKVSVLGRDGSEVMQGSIGAPLQLPAGQYRIVVDGDNQARADVEVRAAATTTIEAYQQAGVVLLRPAEAQP